MSLFDIPLNELTAELRRRGLPHVVWQPEDMEGFGDPAVSLEDRLDECRKALEDCSHGWDVIASILGYSPEEETT